MVIEIPRTSANPFSTDGVSRDVQGVAHYGALPESLVHLLRGHVERAPQTEALVELGGPRLSYRQLWDGAARVAGGLRAAGVAAGDRVAIRYPAGANWTLAFWGCLFAGAIPVAVNIRMAVPEIEYVLADCAARVDLAADTPLPDGEPVDPVPAGRDDVAGLFYTSGTTGRPKGVPTTHEAFLSNAENMIRGLGLPVDAGPILRTLISVPLFHVTGCNSQLLTALYAGGTAVIMPVLDLPALMRALPHEQISFLVTVPAVYALLLRHPDFTSTDIGTVRWVGYGGAPIAPTLVQALQRGFPAAEVFNGYGMTETASLMTVLPDTDAVAHADSVGYACPVVDLAIDPVDGSTDTGELLARGPNVLHAYWGQPDASAAAIVDGWLHTGDVVRVDDAGRIHIVDRVKDIINRGGENVSSVEVEDVLSAAPGVAEAAVLGVPDDIMGEKVGAVIVGLANDLDVATVIAFCAEQLADYKVPQFVSVVAGPLPRNAGGKLLKTELRNAAAWGDPLR